MMTRLLVLALAFVSLPALAQLPGKPTVDFNRHVKPILAKHCYECHSVSKKKEKAGFVFDDVKRLANDVGPGRIIVPKSVEESDLIPVVLGANGKKMMPPEGNDPLSTKEVETLKTWIAEGANLPGIDIAKKMEEARASRPKSIMRWTNKNGQVIRASFEKLEGEFVHLKTEDGKYYKYPLANLDMAGQFQAKQLAE